MSEDTSNNKGHGGLSRWLRGRPSTPAEDESLGAADGEKTRLDRGAQELDALRQLLPQAERTALGDARSPLPAAPPTATDTDARRARMLEKIDALDAQMRKRHGAAAAPDAAKTLRQIAVPKPLPPEFEEIAIHFASGQFAEAQLVLEPLVASGGARQDDEFAWLMLFDLYRATDQAGAFGELAARFASGFQRSAPQWLPLGPQAAPVVPAPVGATAATAGAPWRAPAILDSPALQQLQAAAQAATPPFAVDWGALEAIDPAALPALVALLHGWADAAMQLEFSNAALLRQALAKQTPEGVRQTDTDWWMARLALLRVLDQAAEFDEVALDYCTTYEVSPPAWTPPRCQLRQTDGEALAAVPDTGFAPTVLMPGYVPSAAANGIHRLQLRGDLVGAATEITGLRDFVPQVQRVECDCQLLRRVDFTAAAALLNWVTEQQDSGRAVEFMRVSPLVAAFFSVMGIDKQSSVRCCTV